MNNSAAFAMDRVRVAALFVFLGSCVIAKAQAVPAGQLHVGWAEQNITPDGPVALAGQRNLRISREVLDPITCTALAIETRDGDKSLDQAVFLSCDLVAVVPEIVDKLRARLAKSLPDFDNRKLIAHATHTHTAPVMREGDYLIPADVMQPGQFVDFMVERAEKAVTQAWQNRSPAAMSWGLGQAVVGHNRRAVYAGGQAVMYGQTGKPDFLEIEGGNDHAVELLFFWNGDKQLSGIVVNVACPSQETEGLSTISADFWHETRLALRGRFGENLFVLPQCAAAGDQSPHLMYRKQAEAEMLRRKGVTSRQEIANRLTNAVAEALEFSKETQSSVTLRHLVAEVPLPIRRPTEEEYAFSKQELERLVKLDDAPSWMKGQHTRVVRDYSLPDEQAKYPIELHVVRLGDIAMTTNPFELFLDFGIRIKSRSKAILTMQIQLAGPGTYVPTQNAANGKGYSAEITSNAVGPEGGQVLVEETVRRIDQLFE